MDNFNIVYLGKFPVRYSSDGLNVLLSDLIKSLSKGGTKSVIYTTPRHEHKIIKALADNDVGTDKFLIKTIRVQSVLLSIFERINENNHKKLVKKPLFIKNFLKNSIINIKNLFMWSVDISPLNVFYKLPLLIASLPFVLLIALFVILLALPAILFAFTIIKIQHTLFNLVSRFCRIKPVRKNLKLLKTNVFRFIYNDLVNILYINEQVRFAQKLSTLIDSAFFFTCFEGEVIKNFKGKSLVVFPDSVSLAFPCRYKEYHNAYTFASFKSSLSSAARIICYSEYVRNNQLSNFIDHKSILLRSRVIPQGNFIEDNKESLFVSRKDLGGILSKYEKNFFTDLVFFKKDNHFHHFDYILYPTVDRPHKNLLTVVKSFEILLRKKHKNLKLIFTTPGLSSEVDNYIRYNRLYYDILIYPSVPGAILDLLIKNASVVVHSSLAEGGDVFNFSRAVSNGVPALLSDIPVVREMFERRYIDEKTYKESLFPPADHISLANKIDSILYSKKFNTNNQYEMIKVLVKYTFDQMADSYYKEYKELISV